MAEAYRKLGFMAPENALVEVGEQEEINRMFAGMRQAFSSGGPLAVPQAAALVHQLIVTVHGIATGLAGNTPHADPLVAEAIEHIEREGLTDLTPADLARRLHVGYSTLRRRFRARTGYSLKEYILRVRLRRAKELLMLTHRTVAQVSAEVGFEDPFYFSRLFKAREGTAPTAF